MGNVKVFFVGVFLLSNFCVQAEEYASPAPDNSEVNKRDRNTGELTAGQQSNKKADIAATRKLRRALVKDKSLSTYARNVKIITQPDVMTLKGPVRSEDERNLIAKRAVEFAGSRRIENQMDISPK